MGGLMGSSFHSCQDGLSWDQTPIPGGAGPKEVVRTLEPRKPPTRQRGGFWSVPELAPFGDSFPKTWATPLWRSWEAPSHHCLLYQVGCWYRPWTPQSTSEHLGTG